MGRSAFDGVSDGEWSVLACKVVEERDAALEEVARLKEQIERLSIDLKMADAMYRVTVKERDYERAVVERLRAALEMVRDADDDCRKDGLPTIPEAARRRIDAAIDAARGES